MTIDEHLSGLVGIPLVETETRIGPVIVFLKGAAVSDRVGESTLMVEREGDEMPGPCLWGESSSHETFTLYDVVNIIVHKGRFLVVRHDPAEPGAAVAGPGNVTDLQRQRIASHVESGRNYCH